MYTVIMTVILLLFSVVIYFFCYRELVNSFRGRLLNKANSTLELYHNTQYNAGLVKAVNQTSAGALFSRSFVIRDFKNKKKITFNDPGTEAITIDDNVLENVDPGKPYFFSIGKREAAAVEFSNKTHESVIIVAAYDKDRIEWLADLRLILILAVVLSVLVVLFVSYLFSLSLVNVISEFTQKIKHISSEKFSLRLDTGKGKNELQKLAITINDLLDRLQAAFNLQRRFIDNASHELSTPLASIASQMDVALQRERSGEDYKKALVSMNDDVRRLSMLVRSLLEIAKVSGSMGGTELTPVRIDELLMRIPADLKKINPLYDVKIDFENLPENENALILYGNEHLLSSAIKNIVHNACKFSEDKKARLVLAFTNDDMIVSIHDKGPGIDEHDLKNIFQPFYRSHKHQSYVAGAGLGLSLAQRIVGLHKGNITVQSQVGVGTTFIITIPIEGGREAEATPPKNQNRKK